jgi:hypothetical protein
MSARCASAWKRKLQPLSPVLVRGLNVAVHIATMKTNLAMRNHVLGRVRHLFGRLSGWHLIAFVAAFPFVGSIAIPVFFTPRGQQSRLPPCARNLHDLDSAKEQYAMDNKLEDGAVIPTGALWARNGYLSSEPKCPNGGLYTIRPIGVDPTCSLAELPPTSPHGNAFEHRL